jgi:hypothetical protein
VKCRRMDKSPPQEWKYQSTREKRNKGGKERSKNRVSSWEWNLTEESYSRGGIALAIARASSLFETFRRPWLLVKMKSNELIFWQSLIMH